ncbi:hypothetical protein I3F58_11950 [Streptomyces sp. MUM 203J]|uniref:hypothetical protein n=1 Tax=Streptomyces sp. MUM 203J TaxID=2791990 RepID=UPI001F0434A8|nr:hypothetical protein [Streptomyces sp. MUM 203J]MCH0540270.1 hypothetical protein [Streptomyces sp. MUM 203J]
MEVTLLLAAFLLFTGIGVTGPVLLVVSAKLHNGLMFARPMGLTGMAATSAAGAVVWAYGALAPMLDVQETCEYWHGVEFDDDFWSAHLEESRRLFPLHSRCNAGYGLVPSWVNPTVVCPAALASGCLIAALYTGPRARRGTRRPEPAAPVAGAH